MKQIIQTLLGDFSLLYKNFIHWNISKILIVIFSFLLGILFALPFLIILIVLMNLDPIEWKDIISTFYTTQTVGLSFLTAISTHLFYVIIEIILIVLGFLAFGFGSSYQLVLKAKLNLDYKKGILTGFFKNYYFSVSKIWKTIGIFSWIGLVFLGLFFLVALIIIASIFLYGGIDNAYMLAVQSETISSFSLLVLFITILGILIFLYLAYRMNYAYIIMLDEENYPNEKSALSYVKESFTLTAGVKFFKFLFVAVLFSVCILFPIDYLGQYLEGIESKIGVFFYTIVIFLTINGLFEMLLVSTYYSIMFDDTQKNHASSQQEVI